MNAIISVSPKHEVITTKTSAFGSQMIEQILKQSSETGWVTHGVVYTDDNKDFYFVHGDSDTERTSDYIFD